MCLYTNVSHLKVKNYDIARKWLYFTGNLVTQSLLNS
jgi:hypothetical protein